MIYVYLLSSKLRHFGGLQHLPPSPFTFCCAYYYFCCYWSCDFTLDMLDKEPFVLKFYLENISRFSSPPPTPPPFVLGLLYVFLVFNNTSCHRDKSLLLLQPQLNTARNKMIQNWSGDLYSSNHILLAGSCQALVGNR